MSLSFDIQQSNLKQRIKYSFGLIIINYKMLCKAFRKFRRSGMIKYCFSDKNNASDAFRVNDYAALRSNALSTYNTQMKILKNHYLNQYKQYQQSISQAQTQSQTQKIQQDFNKYLSKYYDVLNSQSSWLNRQLEKIEKQQKTDIIKVYLLDNLPEKEQKIERKEVEEKKLYIPNKLVLKKFYHGSKSKAKELAPQKQILLVGVEQEDEHCFFISKLIDQMSIKNIVTMVSPDLPYFIKTERSYNEQWVKFINDTDYAKKSKFYLNPQPKKLEDICLHEHHIPLVRRGLARSKTFIQNFYCMMRENQTTNSYEPDPLLSGLVCQGVKRVYFANYPAFQEKRMIADNTSLARMRELFQLHLRNVREGRLNFSAQWLFPQQVLTQKLGHILGVTRAVVQTTNQRTIILCPSQLVQLLSIQWQLGHGKLNYNYHDRGYYFNFPHSRQSTTEQTFMEFIEKLVILDLITEPIITKYFVKHRSFPFLCEHTLGGLENTGKIFAVWMHYYNSYFDLLGQKKLESQSSAERKTEFMQKFEEPTNV